MIYETLYIKSASSLYYEDLESQIVDVAFLILLSVYMIQCIRSSYYSNNVYGICSAFVCEKPRLLNANDKSPEYMYLRQYPLLSSYL